MSVLDEIRQVVIEGQIKAAPVKVQQALDEGLLPDVILNEGLIAGMKEVGNLFEQGECFVPEMLVAARTMSAALDVLRPLLVAQGVKPIGTVAIGTVKGDLHDIGKKLVSMMLEGSGFQVVDLGNDVPPEKFIQAITDGAQVVAMSALLTTTMTNMKATIESIRQAGLRDKARIIVGGAPVTQGFADEIGADAYAVDASSAVRKVRELVGVA